MPPDGPLPAQEIANLTAWIRSGAVWPEAKVIRTTATGKISAEHRNWWAFRPLTKSAGKPSIDAMIAAAQTANGVTPVALADRRTLLRRLSFDLTGLPPTPQEVDAFLASGNVAAEVDRLLASPRFGERWGRYWLDVARYGEDDVLGLSQEKYANAWRYRDWVIDAFNRDLGYELFVKAQIAADQLEGDYSIDLRPALGFLGLGPWQYSVSPPPQARADERHDRVDAVSRGFLGLTVACARCHDHKFDPITTRDYYALAGVFANTEYREFPLAAPDVVERSDRHQQKIRDQEKRIREFIAEQQRQLGAALATQAAAYIAAVLNGEPGELNLTIYERWDRYLANPDKNHSLANDWNQIPELLVAVMAEKKEVDEEKERALEPQQKLKATAAKTRLPNGFETYDEFCPGCDVAVRSMDRDRYMLWQDFFREPGGVLSFTEKELEPFLSGERGRHLQDLRAELARLKKTAPEPYPFLHAVGDKRRVANLKIAIKGDPYRLGDEAPRRFLEVLSGPGEPELWTSGSGRLQLAEAVARQPITARVAVNRIWMHLLGRGLVGSPSNFGKYGDRPSHPELLEYLAARFVEQGGSTKKLVREIVLSQAYQRSSVSNAANEGVDAANKWYWRAHRERLDAESLRDSLLFVSGSLEPAIGGASEELTAESVRRTVYGRVSRFKLNDTLSLFDFPSPSITSEKRNVTHVPLQRLFFLNNELVRRQASALAARIEKEGGDDRLRYAYRLLFSREPSAQEQALGADFLNDGGWRQLAQVLLSSNEFLFVD
jgi:hypothetical protein